MRITLAQRDERFLSVGLFQFDSSALEKIRSISGRTYVPEERLWLIPYTLSAIEQFMGSFKSHEISIDAKLMEACPFFKEVGTKAEATREKDDVLSQSGSGWDAGLEHRLRQALALRGYSLKTIKAYCSQVECFYRFLAAHQLAASDATVQRYSLQLLDRGCSHSHVNQALSAIKFYHGRVLEDSMTTAAYIRPKKEHKLPNVLSLSEVKRILSSFANLKHRSIMYITYSSGLRVSEVVRLRMSDFDRERKTLHVRQGKGRRDRQTLLSDAAFAVIQQYVEREQPVGWLFPGIDIRYTSRNCSDTRICGPQSAIRMSACEMYGE
ncbi:site-specific integrase [Paenibacillus sp. R14(2021)]|uniref:tyrosine-type recombinase/integrase n=1 Tax=Paenibacillus sp. R14(2021) TaxID=2859228 RepID=UPI002158859A|nr:site-specific integrase [Paenibacillus sp. R14(2021)]